MIIVALYRWLDYWRWELARRLAVRWGAEPPRRGDKW